ncbi:hypothetical protein [Streptomyces sp. NPDC002690]
MSVQPAPHGHGRGGYLREMPPLEPPHVPGVDLSGTIRRRRPGRDRRDRGTAVAGFLPLHSHGASAECALAPAGILATVPQGVDPVDVAAVPGVALTADQATSGHGALKAGQSVLVNGGESAVGGYAVQLAHRAGAHVTATASPRSAERVRGPGADEVAGRRARPWRRRGPHGRPK